MFGISVPQLIIILVIVVLLFGTKKLKSLGGDLGSALKGFKKAVSEEEDADFKEPKDTNEKKITEDKSAETSTKEATVQKTEQKEPN
jgi:sec-independent protein translocase protein TatA